jgi:hypothetical protein
MTQAAANKEPGAGPGEVEKRPDGTSNRLANCKTLPAGNPPAAGKRLIGLSISSRT